MTDGRFIRSVDVLGEVAWRRLQRRGRWRRLISVLEQESRDAPSLERAAELAGVGQSWFWRDFRNLTSLTWGRFVHTWRMHEARRMCGAEPELSLYGVARRVGYATEKELARAFAEFWGHTPRGKATTVRPRIVTHGAQPHRHDLALDVDVDFRRAATPGLASEFDIGEE